MAQGNRLTLLGRDTHQTSIEDFLGRAVESSSTMCLFGGPGLGKTALLDAAAASAADRGIAVLRAAGTALESEVGLATLHQLIFPRHVDLTDPADQQSSALTSMFGLADGDQHRVEQLSGATAALLRHCFGHQPVLMIVDDWQWVDSRSAAVLTSLECGLLIAIRAESAVPARLIRAEVLAVRPLDDAQSYRLLYDRFPTLAKRVARRVLGEGEGNPLALLELARSLSEAQRNGREPLPAILRPDGRLYRHYARLVTELPSSTRRLLLLAALSDGYGTESVTDGWLPAELAELGRFEQGRNRWTFSQPMVRSAAVRCSTAQERAAAHRELALLVTDRPEERATHLAEATVGSDESVAAVLEEAAHRALTSGNALNAVTSLLRAADLSTDGPQRSRRLAQAAYVGANVVGDLRTLPALLTAARLADPLGTASLPIAVAAAHLLLNGDGHIDTAHRLLTATLDAAVAQSRHDDPLLVEALYQLADVCFYGARDDLWAPLKDLLARLGPDVPAMLRIYVHALHSPASLTDSDRTRLDTALASLDTEQDPTVICRVGRIAVRLNQTGACRPALERVVDDGRAGGAVGSAINAMMVLGLDDLNIGRDQAADMVSAEALQLCDAYGYGLMAWPLQLIRMIVAARRGRADLVREPAVRVATWAVPRGVRIVTFHCCWAQATLAAGSGDFEEAYHHCVAVTAPGVLPPEVPVAVAVSLELIESAIRTGRREEAVTHARAVAAAGLPGISPAFDLTVLTAAALVAEDDDEALALFARAVAAPGAPDLSWDYARAQLYYGERLRRARAITEARGHLTAARTAFERMGATPWSARADRELRAAKAPRTRVAESGATALTAQEAQVSALAATGLSNRQIASKLLVSHRTVAAHLGRAYDKLGVRTRAALGAALGSDEDAEAST